MSLEKVIDSIWRSRQDGVYYPEEWKGRMSQTEAYEVQLGMLARHIATGDTQVGWKVGLTAKAIQDQFGVYEPVFGFLLASGAAPSGTRFTFADLIRPGFEPELCLTVGIPLQGPGVTLEQARSTISAVAPALEIVERRGDPAADLNLMLVDNAQQRAFVTGNPTSPLPVGLDLSKATVGVLINGKHMGHASAAEVMGNPAASIAWLANKLAQFDRRLEAGMQVMSGSFTRQYPVNRGDHIEARFVPFGPVTADFR